jgi:putative colanic acid biosynthesis acetyltransferase WcaF
LNAAPPAIPADGASAEARRHSTLPVRLKIKRVLWSMVEATLFHYSFHTWSGFRSTLLRLFGAQIGRKCMIRRTCRTYYPWNLKIGDLSCLGDFVQVYNLAPIEIGKGVTISQEAYLCTGTHDYRLRSMPLVTSPIYIEDDAWICARAFVGPGITVGKGGIVAAAAVVTRDVEDWTIVGGNPAKFIKVREKLQ